MEHQEFGKIKRLFRDVIITEKIHGTQSAVHIEEAPDGVFSGDNYHFAETVRIKEAFVQTFYAHGVKGPDGKVYGVGAQSNKRMLTPEHDNHGFARWVRENAEDLVRYLGVGAHFGEWAGPGSNGGYGLKEKKLFLFNTNRWENIAKISNGLLDSVPILYEGPFSTIIVEEIIEWLRDNGSIASPGYQKPEGIVVFHPHTTQTLFKITLESDHIPKSLVKENK